MMEDVCACVPSAMLPKLWQCAERSALPGRLQLNIQSWLSMLEPETRRRVRDVILRHESAVRKFLPPSLNFMRPE
jgi:hypothetical protein